MLIRDVYVSFCVGGQVVSRRLTECIVCGEGFMLKKGHLSRSSGRCRRIDTRGCFG